MKFTMAGIILFTQKYEEFVGFYGNVLELEILHKIDRDDERLTTLLLGDTYLMVETGGFAHKGQKPLTNCPIKFRFNVPHVKTICDELQGKGIKVDIHHHTWGITAEFCDPDGNRCALRSDKGFGD